MNQPRGSLTKQDAQIVYDFSTQVAGFLKAESKVKLYEQAKTVNRIAFLALYEIGYAEHQARMNGVVLDDYPYKIENE